ncbi:hypothetical protein CALCODRAFT_423439, partial [Calocera cornea HHB12733]
SYLLALPQSMRDRRIHPVFHAALLRPFVEDETNAYPNRDPDVVFGDVPNGEQFVELIDLHRWVRNKLQFHFVWSDGDQTWESADKADRLVQLDEYLALQGVHNMDELP